MKPLPFGLLASLLAFAFFAANAPAQDITISDPVILPGDFPDENLSYTQPIFKSTWEIFPDDKLAQTDKFSYAFVTQYVDENGNRRNPRFVGGRGWNNYLANLLRESQPQPTFTPANLNGQPIGGEVLFAVIFNPASASQKSADAITRVLAVAPVTITHQQYKDLRDAKESNIITADVHLDETGAITGCEFSENTKLASEFKTEIDSALALWRFAPARAAGKPIASTLSIQLLLRPPGSGGSPGTSPKLISSVHPFYPFALKKKGITGQVTVQFIVDVKGNVKNPVVVQSSHREFEAPAIQAILKWKFKPGTRNGKPVATRMSMPFHFNLNK